jgi:hypothetical protein
MKELESVRMKLWCDVYVAYVSAPNTIKNDGAYIWANIALRRFDETFKEEENENKGGI